MRPRYHKLASEEKNEGLCPIVIEEAENAQSRRLIWITGLALCCLFIGIASHDLWQYRELSRARADLDLERRSSLAGLSRDKQVPWSASGQWVQENQTLEDEAWNSPQLSLDYALVAVHDTWALEKGLPLAQRWPWDETKGLYFVNGAHNVHCIKTLRTSALEAYSGKPQSGRLEHVKHCLQALLMATMCEADDSLRYTGAVHANRHPGYHPSGEGQVRMCRDWSQLHDWIIKNTACFKAHPAHESPVMNEKDRYKNCPDGSTPWLDGAL